MRSTKVNPSNPGPQRGAWRGRLVAASAALTFAMGGCGRGPSGAPRDAPLTFDASTTSGDDASDGAALPDDVGSSPITFVRVAQMSPDLPAVDFCIATHGSPRVRGPLLAQLVAAVDPDGTAAGLTFGQVSTYFTIAAAPYDLIFVPAGSTTCAAAVGDAEAIDPHDALADDAATGPHDALADDAGVLFEADDLVPAPIAATILVTGHAAALPGLHAEAIVDDDPRLTAPAGGGASLRVVNVLLGSGREDFGFGSFAGGWLPLFTDVPLGGADEEAVASAGAADANGYLPIAPFSGATLSARPSVVNGDGGFEVPIDGDAAIDGGAGANADTAMASGASIAFGSIDTLFLFGDVPDPENPPRLLLCTDNAKAGSITTDCATFDGRDAGP